MLLSIRCKLYYYCGVGCAFDLVYVAGQFYGGS